MAIEENNQKAKKSTPKNTEQEIKNSEFALRPQSLNDYVGQEEVKKNLNIIIQAAQKREEAIEHLLFYGPPGLGKTTLANIIAKELKVNIKITSGPAIERSGDLASIITNLQENDILFIDEIHRLKPTVEEIMYSAMEDFTLSLILGKGPAAKSMNLKLPRFTLIGTTTKVSLLSAPLRDRFGHIFKLNFYKDEEIITMLMHNAALLSVVLEEKAAAKIAKSSRHTPRLANRLLRRVRDFAQVSGTNRITSETTDKALESLGIDELGLDQTDRALLEALIEKFHGGPVGLNTLAAAISEEKNTIEEVYEPFLIKLGLLDRTSRGRVATKNAFNHLGLPYKEQSKLIS